MDGGTGFASGTTGDIPYFSGSTTLSKLGIGSTGQVVTVAGGLPTWATVGTPAITQASPSDKGSTTSATGKMLGLLTSFTPVTTGTVLIIISGNLNGSSQPTISIRYGTGTAPAHNAAATGTVAGTTKSAFAFTAGNDYSISGIVTGLTPATTYWVDIDQLTSSGTLSNTNVNVSVFELGGGPTGPTGPTGTIGTASNGLTITGSDVEFGGTLTGNTTITTAGFNTTFTGTGDLEVQKTTNQLKLGVTNTTTISATAPASSNTLTIPDLGGNATVVAVRSGGAAATYGSGTLASGTLTVNTTMVKTGSIIMVTDAGGGVPANIGSLYVSAIVNGVSFTVTSTNPLDNSNLYWHILP